MWLMLIPVALCMVAVYHDCREREIPDSISVRLLITGLLATGLSWHSLTWIDAVLGGLLAFAVTLPFTLSDGIGGGDLKLVSGLGAWLGPFSVLSLLFWSAIAGTASALVAHQRGQRDFPYAPAILAGLVVTLVFPQGVTALVDGLRSTLPIDP